MKGGSPAESERRERVGLNEREGRECERRERVGLSVREGRE